MRNEFIGSNELNIYQVINFSLDIKFLVSAAERFIYCRFNDARGWNFYEIGFEVHSNRQ